MKILDRHDFAPTLRRRDGNGGVEMPCTFFTGNWREGRLAKRSGIVRCGMHYSQGKSTRLFEYTFVAVSINSWESATRAIDCVWLKPDGGGGGGSAGSDPEILNDRAPSAVHARVLFHPRAHTCPGVHVHHRTVRRPTILPDRHTPAY